MSDSPKPWPGTCTSCGSTDRLLDHMGLCRDCTEYHCVDCPEHDCLTDLRVPIGSVWFRCPGCDRTWHVDDALEEQDEDE